MCMADVDGGYTPPSVLMLVLGLTIFVPPNGFGPNTRHIVYRSVVSPVRQYRLLGELHGFQAIFGVFRVESG